jgi:hypothetical protein
MNESEQNIIDQNHFKNYLVNLILSIVLLSWVIMAILLEVFTEGWYLLIYGATNGVGSILFFVGIIVSIIKKPKKSVFWIVTLLLYLVSGALIIYYGITFA